MGGDGWRGELKGQLERGQLGAIGALDVGGVSGGREERWSRHGGGEVCGVGGRKEVSMCREQGPECLRMSQGVRLSVLGVLLGSGAVSRDL